jgi:hypothetical protein
MSDQPPCPNPHGATAEFPDEVIETRSWRLKGVGAYGSDVDVIALAEYRELAHHQATTLETLTKWASSALAAKKRLAVQTKVGEELCEAARNLSALAAGMPGRERLEAALADWDEVMADEFALATEDPGAFAEPDQ